MLMPVKMKRKKRVGICVHCLKKMVTSSDFSNHVLFVEELNKSLCSSSYCDFCLKVSLCNLLPRSFKSSCLIGKTSCGGGEVMDDAATAVAQL